MQIQPLNSEKEIPSISAQNSFTQRIKLDEASTLNSLESETEKYSYCDYLLYPFKKIAEFFQWVFCNLFGVKSSETKSKTESSISTTEENQSEEEIKEVKDEDILKAISCTGTHLAYMNFYRREMPELSQEDVKDIKYLLSNFISQLASYCTSKDKKDFNSFYFSIVKEKPNVAVCQLKTHVITPNLVGIGFSPTIQTSPEDKRIVLSFHISILVQILKEYLYLNAKVLDVLGTAVSWGGDAEFYIIYNGIIKDHYNRDNVPMHSDEDTFRIGLPDNKVGYLTSRGFQIYDH